MNPGKPCTLYTLQSSTEELKGSVADIKDLVEELGSLAKTTRNLLLKPIKNKGKEANLNCFKGLVWFVSEGVAKAYWEEPPKQKSKWENLSQVVFNRDIRLEVPIDESNGTSKIVTIH